LRLGLSRLLINHSLLPLSYLPRNRAGEKIRKAASFAQGIESNDATKLQIMWVSTPC
jgi:hypothetical protein